ncbi:carbohydrate esterase family 5 protein [Xylariaceae sp. FL0662B]|nr:carbohydrate esterase family 5 protein [Xylariaceae sp. FL0662B]
MKISLSLLSTTLVAFTSASPLALDHSEDTIAKLRAKSVNNSAGLSHRETIGTTANEFQDGSCKDVIFIFARGTTEIGNIGANPGPQVIDKLKAALGTGSVAAQGLDYPALLSDNLKDGGCDPEDADKLRDLINQAAKKCPSSKLVVSGYSQGAALVHRAVKSASTSVKNKIAAAVMFGDTQKVQDKSRIPKFDPSKTLILCHDGDKVCEDTLIITPAHLNYADVAPDAVNFVVSKV